jgi:hypothetical protein
MRPEHINQAIIFFSAIAWTAFVFWLGRIGIDDRSFHEGFSEGRRAEREGM